MPLRADVVCGRRGMSVGNFGYLPGLRILLATALLAGFANADRPYAVVPVAAHRAQSRLILAQTFHKSPGIPGSSDSGDASGPGGSSEGTHAPPPVPNFGSGSGSGVSHAAPGLPRFGDDGGNAAAQSHAPPPAPNGAGGSHTAPGVPMMGGNP
jgi:hypothetical protein